MNLHISKTLKYKFFKFIESFKYFFLKNIIYKWRRSKNGWAPNDIWAFDYYMAGVIYNGLQYLKNNTDAIPPEFTTIEEWQSKLDEIILPFKEYYYYQEDYVNRYVELIKSENNAIEIDRISLLSNYFMKNMNSISRESLTEFYESEYQRLQSIKKRMSLIIQYWDYLWI